MRALYLNISILLTSVLYISCNKENPLVDTFWKCEQDNSELRFQDDSNGQYIWTEEDALQSYNFSYDYTYNHITITVVFPNRTFEMAGEIENDIMTLGGKEIQLIYRKQ